MNNKKILFLSALDFKDKSIQVIRKTSEAYVKADWDAHHVVARDEFRQLNANTEEMGYARGQFNEPLVLVNFAIKLCAV